MLRETCYHKQGRQTCKILTIIAVEIFCLCVLGGGGKGGGEGRVLEDIIGFRVDSKYEKLHLSNASCSRLDFPPPTPKSCRFLHLAAFN